MSQRKHISIKTKLAAALLMLDHIPYEDSKNMSADQIISLYQWDHGILHAIEPIDEPWNLTPRLTQPHREKSKIDTGIVAKAKRIDKKWKPFMAAVSSGKKPPKPISKWPKRSFQKRVKPRGKAQYP